MRLGRDEAVNIFRKWLEEKALIRVQGSFSAFSFALWGRLLSLSPTELRIWSTETESELVLRLSPNLEYGYGDDRIVTGDEKRFSECIVVYFTQDLSDTIILAALKS